MLKWIVLAQMLERFFGLIDTSLEAYALVVSQWTFLLESNDDIC